MNTEFDQSHKKEEANSRFEYDDNINVLQGDKYTHTMGSRAHENSPGVPMSLESYESNRKPPNNENAFNGNVENMEDDGNGFFITGINTKGG